MPERLEVTDLTTPAAAQIDKAWAWMRESFPITLRQHVTASDAEARALHDVLGYRGPEALRGLREFRSTWGFYYMGGCGLLYASQRGKLLLDEDTARIMRVLIRLRLEESVLDFVAIPDEVRAELGRLRDVLTSYIARCMAHDKDVSAVDALSELGR